MKRMSDAELEEQNKLCREVKQRSLEILRLMQTHINASDVNGLREAVDRLRAIVDQNEKDGAIGVIATTELCNALLQVDGLKMLEGLQQHPDQEVRNSSTRVFQHIIPRIWSF